MNDFSSCLRPGPWSIALLIAGGLIPLSAIAQTAPTPKAQAQAPAAAERTFDIWEYRLEGNTLLSRLIIEKTLSPYLGPGKSIDVVQQASENLERAYRDAGYPAIYVDIPVQDVVAGVVTLKVTEGKIGRVSVNGARYFTPSGIREQLPSLQSGGVLAVADVQRDIKDLNARSGDLKVAPILKPGVNQGDVDVELKVKDTLPVHGGIEYNNFNSVDTSRPRLRATLSYDNLWQSAHSFALTYQEAPDAPSELNVISASYSMPLDDNWKLSAYAVKSNTNVNTAVDASVGGTNLSVLGDGKVAGVRFVRTLPAQSDYTQTAVLGADYKDFNQQVETSEQPIRYSTWLAQYDATALGEKSITSFTIAANLGVRGLLNKEQQFENKRASARAEFLYLNGGITRTDTIGNDWQVLSRLRWQLSQSPLIDNEQFSIGGFSSVRGYYESQVLGDIGYSAGLEGRTPSIASYLGDNVSELRALVFFDVGEVRVKDPLPEERAHNNLEAVGMGIRLQAFDHLRFLWDIAYPLKDQGRIEEGDWRTYFRINLDF